MQSRVINAASRDKSPAWVDREMTFWAFPVASGRLGLVPRVMGGHPFWLSAWLDGAEAFLGGIDRQVRQ